MSTEQPQIMKSSNVLSDKVNRALHVRTDTPAMKAALSALATLPSSSSTSSTTSNDNGGVIDAKSVRAAIETDALRRALQFQTELQKLARDATILRERVDTVSRVAGHIGRIVDGRIISKEQADVLLHGDESGGGELYGRSGGVVEDTTTSSWELERTLASKLHAAHKSYVDATHRQIAVDAFLDKFDL
eukprot:scaffold13278_cov67-Skeletonema_dohrnii-CCMP3373.AAC.1